LQSIPRVLDSPDAERGLALMRNLAWEAEKQTQ
jgi:hypothetical protein